MEIQKMPDRLNISKKAKQLIEKIDDDNYMGLGSSSINRSELFLFAMSLGIEAKTPTEVVNPYSGGFVLEKSIDSKTKASMYAQFIFLLGDPENELDHITEGGRVFKLAEQYANTGFEIIADYYENKKPDDLVLDLFLELDEQYVIVQQLEVLKQEPMLKQIASIGDKSKIAYKLPLADIPEVAEEVDFFDA